MTTRTTFLLANVVAASFITMVAIPSVVLAQNAQGVVAACVSDVRTWCAKR
jgi:hypothetical protein